MDKYYHKYYGIYTTAYIGYPFISLLVPISVEMKVDKISLNAL